MVNLRNSKNIFGTWLSGRAGAEKQVQVLYGKDRNIKMWFATSEGTPKMKDGAPWDELENGRGRVWVVP